MSPTMIKTAQAEGHHDDGSTRILGFWIYILQDLFLFATFFANFAVFSASYSSAETPKEFIDLNFVLIETFILLTSSITYGFAMIGVRKNSVSATRLWLFITFILGALFISMELYEFHHLFAEGAPYLRDAQGNIIPYANGIDDGRGGGIAAYWSAFFSLVGLHGLHVTAGLVVMVCMFVHLGMHGLTARNKARLGCLSLFWHFLDIVWIGVFTAVYLLGVL
ncbi:MAG: cytochrome (ubi)quinol oxidase subunit III [Candidatus Tokpelaia sp.]|nr:MAG: cytochrome (ubi)quinol oxidase subunit III [Candidatus Tokpelaia sp.]KAA6207082.1 MAG: cytochrome (ubi)quinol oxidase subunit III [Candidatus Tokpelaia sp.]